MMKPVSDRMDAADSRNFQTEAALNFNDKGFQVRRSRAPDAKPVMSAFPT
jgi:hypothetical protein